MLGVHCFTVSILDDMTSRCTLPIGKALGFVLDNTGENWKGARYVQDNRIDDADGEATLKF